MSLALWLACPDACVLPVQPAGDTRLWGVYVHPLKGVRDVVLSHVIAGRTSEGALAAVRAGESGAGLIRRRPFGSASLRVTCRRAELAPLKLARESPG